MLADVAFVDLASLFARGLERSRVTPGETVAVYTEGGARRDVADAFVVAAESLGAHAFTVDIPTRAAGAPGIDSWAHGSGLSACRPVVEAFKHVDLLVDLVMLLFKPEKMEIQETGTRILTCMEAPETVARLFPTEEHRRLARSGEKLLRNASTLTVKSRVGTDLTYELGQCTPICQYGLADEPGRWDHFASAFVATVANDQGVNGQVVFDVGDVITPYIHYVKEPVTMEIKDGFVEDVTGGLEAFFIRDYMSRFDRDAYAVSHVGWGLHEDARWDALMLDRNQVGLDPRSYRGSVMFSTGPNNEFGGHNSTPCHFDMPMRNCSLWVDGELVVDEGRLCEDLFADPTQPDGNQTRPARAG